MIKKKNSRRAYRWVAHMIVRTLGSACQLFEIAGRKGGRQIKCAHAHIVCPRFSCFLYPKPRQFVKKNSIHGQNLIPIKFLLFLTITHQNLFVPIRFPESSHQILLVPFNNPSISFCSHQVPIKILLFPWLWRIGR